MIRFILVHNRQGKVRLTKYYAPIDDAEKARLPMEVHRLVSTRDRRTQSNFVQVRTSYSPLQFRNDKVVYRQYAGLYFCMCIQMRDNELAYLEAIQLFVEILDAHFSPVCEQDLVFHFYKVYALLDELFLAGEIQETNKNEVLARLESYG